MDYSNFKFRCHYQGVLISVPPKLTDNQLAKYNSLKERNSGIGKPLTKTQSEELIELEYKNMMSNKYNLSITAKKLLEKIAIYAKYNRTYTLKTDSIEKGLLVEKESRDLLSEVLGTRLVASTERRENDWVSGAIDIEPKDVIIDIKSSFNLESFTKNIVDGTTDLYPRQMDSYMDLWGLKDSIIAYILADTPHKFIDKKLRSLDFEQQIIDDNGYVKDRFIQVVKEIVTDHLFTFDALKDYVHSSTILQLDWFNDFVEIPLKERVHLVHHKFQPERIEQRNEVLTLCREYMNNVDVINNLG